jgi:hypothetical protein
MFDIAISSLERTMLLLILNYYSTRAEKLYMALGMSSTENRVTNAERLKAVLDKVLEQVRIHRTYLRLRLNMFDVAILSETIKIAVQEAVNDDGFLAIPPWAKTFITDLEVLDNVCCSILDTAIRLDTMIATVFDEQ